MEHKLKECPRCQGRLHVVKDPYGRYTLCRMCGRTFPLQDMVILHSPSPQESPATDTAEAGDTKRLPTRLNLQACPAANKALRDLRWILKPRCPSCQRDAGEEVAGSNGAGFKCAKCERYFTIRTGTLMEGSPRTNAEWLAAFTALTEIERDPEAGELAKAIGTTPEEAEDMLARLQNTARANRLVIRQRMTTRELRQIANHAPGESQTTAALREAPPDQEPLAEDTNDSEMNQMLIQRPEDSPFVTLPEPAPADDPNSADETESIESPEVEQQPAQSSAVNGNLEPAPGDTLFRQRWPSGEVLCPHCGGKDLRRNGLQARWPYRCRGCKHNFQSRTKTLLFRSSTSDTKWIQALNYLIQQHSSPDNPSVESVMRAANVADSEALLIIRRYQEAVDNLVARELLAPGEPPTVERLLNVSPANGVHAPPAGDRKTDETADQEDQTQPNEVANDLVPLPAPTLALTPPAELDEHAETHDRIETMLVQILAVLQSGNTTGADPEAGSEPPCPACQSTWTRSMGSPRMPGFHICDGCGCIFPVRREVTGPV